ncbi:D-alanyl-D-alanine carboxypeptidase family protein [Thermicanus aegyptius]|uniref:D-alanyl-D-alanine carboxypeptidase family protein n=1 Tax=Thermicanus aegyptius TaxID=94009 RepID=UPI000402ED74|nr:D-alanyl-D-alanine carboxypeptidase family protein [Thermicanus aegyptius]
MQCTDRKSKHKKIVLTLLSIFLIAMGISSLPFSVKAAAPNLALEVKSAILVEASTGKVLFEMNAKEPFAPASMTKMMTEYLILDAIKNGKLSWDDVATADDYVYFMGKNGGSRVFINKGEKRTVRELFSAMAIYSANDATVMLAQLLAGSETAFVQMMNEKAKEFGMKNTHFVTASGYPEDLLKEYRPQIEGKQLMSAEDAAILGLRLITDHPEVTQFTSVPFAKFREGQKDEISMRNWNLLLPGLKYAYEGADGLKTGHTTEAKWSFTATAKRGNMRLIAVVMGAETEDKRFQETIKLFDYGFNNFQLTQILPSGATVPGHEEASVSKGKERTVKMVTAAPYMDVTRKGETAALFDMQVTEDPSLLVAPIKKGDRVGTLKVTYKGKEPFRYLTPEEEKKAEKALVAGTDVEKGGFIQLFFRAIFDFIGNLFHQMVQMIGGWFR